MDSTMDVDTTDVSLGEQTKRSKDLNTSESIDLDANADLSEIDLTAADVDLTTNDDVTASSSVCQVGNSTICEVIDDELDDEDVEEVEFTDASICPTIDDSKQELSGTRCTEAESLEQPDDTSVVESIALNESAAPTELSHGDTPNGVEQNGHIEKTGHSTDNNIFQSTALDVIDGGTGFAESAPDESAIEALEQSAASVPAVNGVTSLSAENGIAITSVVNGTVATSIVDDGESDHLTESVDAYSAIPLETLYTDGTQMEQSTTEYIPDENGYFQHAFIELGRSLWSSSVEAQHYTKGCLWSPDGTCLLVPVHLDGMLLFELPQDLYTACDISAKRKLSTLTPAVHVKEGGTVYDCIWYPFMDSGTPATCCWLASRQHEPIHMWDAFTGELRCSYRGYDDVDEVESAISVAFTNDGEKVLGGYKKSIKIFDTNVPGRDTNALSVKQAISCFALTTDSDNTVTAGSWNGYINHYDLRAPKLGSLFTLSGHKGGITWLRYAALADGDSWSLFSGARKDNKILEWDMRNYTQPVREFNRTVSTNQRIYFDLSPYQQSWLVSGDTEGKVRIWDLVHNVEETLPVHTDCCNGVNFHPSYPILATSSGQYHFVDVLNEEEDAPAAQGEDEVEEEPTKKKVIQYENALKLWWIGKCSDLNLN